MTVSRGAPLPPRLQHPAMLACCLLLFLPFSEAAAEAPGRGRTPATVANPWKDPEACGRTVRSWMCDPDGLLSAAEQDLAEGIAKQIADGSEPYKSMPCGDRGDVGPQVAVAIVRRMDPQFVRGNAERAAGMFAREVHSAWGVGFKECENGVLLFVSIEDRRVFISRGKGLTAVLSDHALDSIIDRMRPYLKAKRYGDAVAQGVAHVGTTVAAGPDTSGGLLELLPVILFVGAFLAIGFFSVRDGRRRGREYQAVKVHLNRINKSREEAAAGTYAATSCPICLEDFDTPPGGEAVGTEGAASTEPTAPASSGSGTVRSRSRGLDGASPLSAPDAAEEPLLTRAGSGAGSSPRTDGSSGQPEEKAKGDGDKGGEKPVREPVALPCGHVFCESCIDEWMKSQRTCPICRKDPTRRPGDDRGDDHDDDGNGDGDGRQPPPPSQDCGQPEASARPSSSGGFSSRHRYWRRARRGMYMPTDMTPEMVFRLASLQRRYPAYVTPHMVNRWSNDINYGRQIDWSSDTEFLHRDPARVEQTRSYGRSGGHSSFGGGTSGGGRGGGW